MTTGRARTMAAHLSRPSESDMRQARNGGYILLVRPFLQDQPVAGPP